MSRLPSWARPAWPLVKRASLALAEVSAHSIAHIVRAPGGRGLPTAAQDAATVALFHPGRVSISEIVSPSRTVLPLPRGEPSGHWSFAAHASTETPAAFVASIKHGCVVGGYGAVMVDGTLVSDLSPYFGTNRASQHPLYLRPWLPRRTRMSELAVVTTRGANNYCHFLFDVLPRIELVERAGLKTPYLYVPSQLPFQRELLAKRNVDGSRLVDPGEFPHIESDMLHVPTVPAPDLTAPSWVIDHLRKLMDVRRVTYEGRKIYVSRQGGRFSRRVLNHSEVLTALAERGFEEFAPGSVTVEEQVRTFAEAELIVGVHGAALANLAFARPGAVVIELFPHSFVNPCFWKLSHTVGLRYYYLVGVGTYGRPTEIKGVDADFTVDVTKLLMLVDEASRMADVR